jgi:hypothetical protein
LIKGSACLDKTWFRFTFFFLFLLTIPPPTQSTQLINVSPSPLPLLQHSSLGHVRRYGCNVTAVRAGFHYYAFQQILLFRCFFSEMTVLAIIAAVRSKNITTFSLFTSQKWSLGMM